MKKTASGRWTLTFLCCTLGIPACTKIIDGISADTLETALLAGALLGFVYLLIRPLIRLLTLPIGCLTLGLFGFVIDIALIFGLSMVYPGFTVDGIVPAALSALLVNALCMVVGGWK